MSQRRDAVMFPRNADFFVFHAPSLRRLPTDSRGPKFKLHHYQTKKKFTMEAIGCIVVHPAYQNGNPGENYRDLKRDCLRCLSHAVYLLDKWAIIISREKNYASMMASVHRQSVVRSLFTVPRTAAGGWRAAPRRTRCSWNFLLSELKNAK
jgi:hypothetical protein